MIRRVLRVGLSVVAFALVTPAAVGIAARLGAEPTHWSGVRLADIESPFLTPVGGPPPEAAARLLDQARLADESDAGDLAPSWWDGSAGEVVLGAVTARGSQMRETLARGSGVAYRIERRPHSSRALTDVMNEATDLSPYGVFWTVVDAEGNRVHVGARRLSPDLFSAAATRFGDTVAVMYDPFAPETYPDEPPPDQPAWWNRSDPLGTWLTLTTGFPWYAGGVLVLVAAFWTVPWLSRRPHRRAPTPTAAAPTPTA